MAHLRFFGVRAVRAAFVLAMFGWGVGFYGPPVYLAAVVARTGWSLDLVSAVTTVHFLAGAALIATLPRLYVWFGLPAVTTVGSVLTAAGVLGWAVALHPWQLFIAAMASGAGWVTMGAVPVNAIVARWYVSGRPAALSRAYNGATLGGALFAPLWVALIRAFGFAQAVMVVAVGMIAVVAWLSWTVFRKTPQDVGQRADGARMDGAPGIAPSAYPAADGVQRALAAGSRTSRDAPACGEESRGLSWRDRRFITLAAGMAIGLFAQIGLLAHLFKLLVPVLGAQWASLLMGGGTACAIAGRAIAARAVKRFGDRRTVAAASYGAQALGALALLAGWPDRAGLLVIGIALFGAGIGNATSLPPLVAQTAFPADDVPRVIARIVAISQATYAFGPALFGLLLDAAVPTLESATRRQVGPFLLAGLALQLSAAAIYLAGRRPARLLQF